MKRVLFIVCLFFCQPAWPQETYRARVVDSETGEPLPYASVRSSSKVETLANANGDFAVKAKAKDVLTFSLIGYETVQVRAGEMETPIKLQPVQGTESGLSEISIDNILNVVQIRANYSVGTWSNPKTEPATYFYRYRTRNKEKEYCGEAIIRAESANNLHDLEYQEKTFYNEVEDETSGDMPLYLQRSLINFVLELGAGVFGVQNWKSLHSVPLGGKGNKVSANYSLRCNVMKPRKGKKFYEISMQPQEKPDSTPSKSKPTKEGQLVPDSSHVSPKGRSSLPLGESWGKVNDCGRLAGTLYLDRRYRPMTFVGELLDYGVEMLRKGWAPAVCHVRIDYVNRHGGMYVKSAIATLKYDDIESHAVAFQVPEDALKREGLSTVILRTDDEERMMRDYLKSKE